jgi:hypothetical protein
MSFAQRQRGLGSLQSLALAFFITAKHQRLVRRIEIKSDDVPVGVSYAQIGSTFVSFSSGLSGRFDSGLLFVQNDQFLRDFLNFELGSPAFPPVGQSAFLSGFLTFVVESPSLFDPPPNVLTSSAPPTAIVPSQWDSITAVLLWESHFNFSLNRFIDPSVDLSVTSASVSTNANCSRGDYQQQISNRKGLRQCQQQPVL